MILKAPRYFLEEIVSPACNNDENIIQAFADIPRALFVDEGMKVKAYEDKALPIGMGQTISQVTTVANMLYMLELEKSDNVLEIGSGSGFVTALLSRLARHVYAVELLPKLMEKSRTTIKSLRITNVSMKSDDGGKGWLEYAPYDKIIASAGAKRLPQSLLEQLKDGGILVLPLNNSLMKYKKEQGRLTEEKGRDCSFVDFVGS
ncbi:MAG: protein-L-isoaspartate(D-aspartate) O-methyltransferase [Mucispirillum sp.]|nr:protein-L-isoaspartate(D-aspartate) O-methyltransferase [Mucispirillum sp.]